MSTPADQCDVTTSERLTYTVDNLDKAVANDGDSDIGLFDALGESRGNQVFEVVLA